MLDFKSLSDAVAEPGEFLLSDFSKFERSPLLHVGFQALDQFQVRLQMMFSYSCNQPLPRKLHGVRGTSQLRNS